MVEQAPTQSAPTVGGGIELHRGMEFERTAAIYHLLLRLVSHPSARITIESHEDFAITWTDDSGLLQIEDVQCKKIEQSAGPQSPGMSDWIPGKLAKDEFRAYLIDVRRGASSIDRLKGHPERFFTLYVYADLARAIEKFVPPGVVTGDYTRGPATRDYFPPDYRFPTDPNQYLDIGTEDERRRIRVVPNRVPKLRIDACNILVEFYGVSVGQAPYAADAIEAHLYRHVFRNAGSRTFRLLDVEKAIQRYVSGPGKWENVSALISAGDDRPDCDPFVSWSDFRAGRLIETDIIRQGLEAFTEHRFIAVSGYHGCGKTVLCKYLAWTYLEREPEGKCFYLQISPGDDLGVELDIFRAALAKPWLFIIDDAHLAEDQVAALCQAYLDRAMIEGQTARLVVATTRASSTARRVRAVSPLDEAHPLRFDLVPEEAMCSYLAEYQAKRHLEKIDSSAVLLLADGSGRVNFGVVLILAHAAEPDWLRPGKQIVLESLEARDSVGKWIAGILRISLRDFDKFVAPIFTAGSFGLPVKPDFNECVERLVATGFLVPDPAEPAFLKLRSEYASLAWIVSGQHLNDHYRFFRDYLCGHNSLAPRLAQALAIGDVSKRTLHSLLDDHLRLFLSVDRSWSVDFGALASIIASANRVNPRSASRFVRLCLAEEQEGAYPAPIIRGYAFLALRTDVRPLTRFLAAAYRADRNIAQTLGAILIGHRVDSDELILAFRASPSPIGDLLDLLREAKNCDRRFAREVAPKLAETEWFKAKWDAIAASGDPTAMVRALAALKAINRRLFIGVRDRQLTAAQLDQWIVNVHDVPRFAQFLVGVKRLSARIASQALRTLLSRRRDEIMSLIRSAADIGDSSALISSIALVDRRLAIPLARACSTELSAQVARETSYSRLGESLGRLGKSTTVTLAAKVAEHTPMTLIIERMQSEKRRFEPLGRTLARLTAIAPDIASKIAQALDYHKIYERVRERPLMNLTQLTRGLLLALPVEMHADLLKYIRLNRRLLSLFRSSLINERSLHHLADTLSALVSAGLSTTKIYDFFDLKQVDFNAMVRDRIERTGAHPEFDLQVANLLFALAQLGPEIASKALDTYTEVLADNKPAPTSATKKTGSSYRRPVERAADRREFIDMAATGALLHVMSMIDEDSANMLLEARSSAFHHVGSERNLGRQAVLILGIHNVSRTECLNILRNAYTPERLRQVFEVPDSPRELIQFLYGIQTVSAGECRRFASFFLSSSADELRDYLEAEVDLHELSRWIMTLAAVDRTQLLDFRALAVVCAEYDTRLWALVEAAQAMIACDARDAALVLSGAIHTNINQARSVSKLSHCVQLWLKAQYVADVLRDPTIMSRLGENLLPQVIRLIALDNDSVSFAFAFNLWHDNKYVPKFCREKLTEYCSLKIFRAVLGDRPIESALAAILLKVSDERLHECLDRLTQDQCTPWAYGLLQLVLDVYHPFDLASMVDRTPVPLHYSNLKYALAYYAKRRAHQSISDEEKAELGEREADETSAAVRALLQPDFDATTLRTRPYNMWTYLRRTLLALKYLEWETEIDRASNAEVFRKTHSINPEPLLDISY